MDTNSNMRGAAAAVTGARHLRTARNGQDAAAVWTGARREGPRLADVTSGGAMLGGVRDGGPVLCGPVLGGAVLGGARDGGAVLGGARDGGAVLGGARDGGAVLGGAVLDGVRDGGPVLGAGLGAIVVCDGCGSGASSEVGARIGAQLVIGALSARLAAGARPSDPALWDAVRAEVCAALGRLVDAMPGDRERIVHEQFLFTIVAAAVADDEVAVWAIGDGAYAIAGRDLAACPPRVLGPFADNQPPYLGYDLLAAPPAARHDELVADARAPLRCTEGRAPAHLEIARTRAGSVVIATDGVAELGLDTFTADGIDRWLRHPDALRRQLAILARGTERVDWAERRTIRTPAALQDDGAVAVLRWVSEEPS